MAKKVDLQAASMQGLPYLNHKKANTYLPNKNAQPAAGYMIPIVKKDAIKRAHVNASPNQIKSQSK